MEIRRGSFNANLRKLNKPQRMQLLNLAERWGASEAELRRILASFSVQDNEDGGASLDVHAARRRLQHRLRGIGLSTATLIPLGAHCLAWTLLNRWGMRSAESIPYLFNPFALAVHRPQFIARTIETDFADYLDLSQVKATVSTGGYSMIARNDGSALWNHCIGDYWTGGNFRRFKDIMAIYVERFRAHAFVASQFVRIFVLHLPNAASDEQAVRDIETIRSALQKRVIGPHGLIAIDTGRRGGSEVTARALSESSAIIRAPMPDSNYKWPMAESYNSNQGLDYELSIVRHVRSLRQSLAEQLPTEQGLVNVA